MGDRVYNTRDFLPSSSCASNSSRYEEDVFLCKIVFPGS